MPADRNGPTDEGVGAALATLRAFGATRLLGFHLDGLIQQVGSPLARALLVLWADRLADVERHETAVRALRFVEDSGYRRCSIAACNCGSWHQGFAETRLSELRDVLEPANGQTLLGRAEDLVAKEGASTGAAASPGQGRWLVQQVEYHPHKERWLDDRDRWNSRWMAHVFASRDDALAKVKTLATPEQHRFCLPDGPDGEIVEYEYTDADDYRPLGMRLVPVSQVTGQLHEEIARLERVAEPRNDG